MFEFNHYCCNTVKHNEQNRGYMVFLAEKGGSVSVYITITKMVVIYVGQNEGYSLNIL